MLVLKEERGERLRGFFSLFRQYKAGDVFGRKAAFQGTRGKSLIAGVSLTVTKSLFVTGRWFLSAGEGD